MSNQNPIAHDEPGAELLTIQQITQKHVPVTVRGLRKMIADGRFPPADIAIGNSLRWWRKSTILRWMDAHSAATARRRERREEPVTA